jgi:hypothetical protein
MSKKGYKQTQKHKNKLSAAQKGEKGNMWGKHHSQERKNKISASLKGRTSPMKGREHTQKAKNKCSKSMQGKLNNPNLLKTGKEAKNWKGGSDASKARTLEKRRGLSFIPLNEWFVGCEAHHIDEEFVIHIPKEMHKSVYHSVIRNINMDKINDLAIDFCYGD